LKNNADVHVGDDEPPRVAAASGFSEIVKELLDYGVNAHALDDEAIQLTCLQDLSFLIGYQ